MLGSIIQYSPVLYLTQSLWRDEVFSVFMAQRPIIDFFKYLTFEPPLYYILLHYWIKIFGTSEIAVRSLSLVAFALSTILVIFWAEKVFKKHWLRWWLPVFFFLNPMLIYYSMEVRTYAWYILFTVWSVLSFHQKHWTQWTIATILGFYTHSFFIIVPFAQAVYTLVTHRKFTTKDPMVRAGFISALAILPWFVKIFSHVSMLASSWYFPVDLNLVMSVLGNLFVGYEGTPGGLWTYTKYLSLVLVGASVLVWKKSTLRATVGPILHLMYLPLLVVLGISFFKPMYVNRYMIPVTVAEVLIVTFAIWSIKNHAFQKAAGVAALLFIIAVNIWYPARHAKLDIRAVISEINTIKQPADVVIADSPLVFFESIYYSADPTRVYLYNPYAYPFPSWVGDAIVSPSQMVAEFPPYPVRAFVVHENGSFDLVFRAPMTASRR